MSVVEFNYVDGIATVRLNRPEKHNAMSPEVLVRLYQCWTTIRDDSAIRVAILTGTGEKSFCNAMEILLTGDLFDAQRALEIGFVNYVVPPEELMPRAMALARRIAANGPVAVRLTRQAVRECIGRPEAEALALEEKIAIQVYKTQDAQEGPRAFLEKRPPRFTGH